MPLDFLCRLAGDVVNRGVALYDGKVYLGTLDGRLIALDARSGKPVWQTVTADQSQPYAITGAPRIAKGMVLIGNAGGEFGVRGYLSAYDAKSGRLVWRTYSVPGDPARGFESKALESAATTWHGKWWIDLAGFLQHFTSMRSNWLMTNPLNNDIRSGASHVDETERLASGLSDPRQSAQEEIEDPSSETALADLTLSMFTQGSSIRVRVGNAHNSSEFYESTYDSADAANSAMLDAGVLTKNQIKNISQPAGTGIVVRGTTVEQLLAAGLKRHGTSTL